MQILLHQNMNDKNKRNALTVGKSTNINRLIHSSISNPMVTQRYAGVGNARQTNCPLQNKSINDKNNRKIIIRTPVLQQLDTKTTLVHPDTRCQTAQRAITVS